MADAPNALTSKKRTNTPYSKKYEEKVKVTPSTTTGRKRAKQDHKLLVKIAKMINCQETKYLLLSNQTLNATVAGTSYGLLLNGLQRGSSVQSRIGDSIKGLRLNIKGRMLFVQNDQADQTCNVRVLVIKDNEANGAAPLFNTTTPATGYLFNGAQGSLPIWSMYNFNNTAIKRYSIRYDKTYSLNYNSNTNSHNGNCSLPINFSINNLGCFSYVRDNLGTVADMEESLYIYIFCDKANPIFQFDSAFYFADN